MSGFGRRLTFENVPLFDLRVYYRANLQPKDVESRVPFCHDWFMEEAVVGWGRFLFEAFTRISVFRVVRVRTLGEEGLREATKKSTTTPQSDETFRALSVSFLIAWSANVTFLSHFLALPLDWNSVPVDNRQELSCSCHTPRPETKRTWNFINADDLSLRLSL